MGIEPRPKGDWYRNLREERGTIWYDRVLHKRDPRRRRRFHVDTECTDWEEAAYWRDAYEREKGITELVKRQGSLTFVQMAERYLREDMGHLSARVKYDRERMFRTKPDKKTKKRSELIEAFGDLHLDEIRPEALRAWWGTAVQAKGRALATGRSKIHAMAAVYAYALEIGEAHESPVPAFRAMLSRKSRTKRGRAAAQSKARPIEDSAALARITSEAEAEGARAHALVLCLLDAGLRLGEVMALRWGAVTWGQDGDDEGRSLLIDQSKASGVQTIEEPKSGRARRVALSRRLRGTLEGLYDAQFRPGPDVLIFADVDSDNFRRREWRRMCKRAKAGQPALKDLRDTFASWLLTNGIPLGYVSAQLGHADVAITAKHYARWCGGGSYRRPLEVQPGEVPADLLARIVALDCGDTCGDSGPVRTRLAS